LKAKSKAAVVWGAALISGLGCLYGIDNVTTYGADILDMCSVGHYLVFVPIILAPIQFVLVLKVLGDTPSEDKKRRVSFFILGILAIILAPALAVSLADRLELDSVEIPRHTLNAHELQTIQELQVVEGVFPFMVRFHWAGNNIRIVFKSSENRPQIVRSTLAAKLRPEGKQ
jgi:hypothetical protein